ncbi:MAG: hypothetical protein ACT4PS_16405 [Betaproteobacteria bacterium]
MVGWTGLLVPAKTPKDVSGAIHRAAVSVLNAPETRKRLESLGYIVVNNQRCGRISRARSKSTPSSYVASICRCNENAPYSGR